MATHKKRTVVYTDHENLEKVQKLNSAQAGSDFWNWALKNYFEKYPLRPYPHRIKYETCPECLGTGEEPCPYCDGQSCQIGVHDDGNGMNVCTRCSGLGKILISK